LAQALDQARGSRQRACGCRAWLAIVRRALGHYSAAKALLKETLAIAIEGPHVTFEVDARQALALIYAETGRPEKAHPHLARCREIIAGGEDWRGLVGHIARAEAVVAAAEDRMEDAQPLFAKAVEIHRRYQVPFDQAETLHCSGRALLAAGDREAARGKLNAAMELYQRHEAGERWLEKMQTDHLRAQVPSVAGAQPAIGLPETGTEKRPGEDSQLTGTFRQHGEYWTLSLAGSESRLRDRKGFHYIAWLLRHPDQEFAAWDLVANVEPGSLPAATRVRSGRIRVPPSPAASATPARFWTQGRRRNTSGGLRTCVRNWSLPAGPTTRASEQGPRRD
jgi:tetratricopeptide (TPR) repeat protein